MMSTSGYVIATAGHVDHGKSALVKALTGTDPDRLQEEKLRGLTIDLGFAYLNLTDPATPGRHIDAGLVDVPGHEDFVKNMVAGVGSADAVLLVIAADDGWMPQTEEHVQILTYLGVERAVIALSKIDLVSDETEAVAQVRQHLEKSQFAEAPIVPVSVVTEHGLGALKSTLRETLTNTATAKDIDKPRLFVDRAFVLNGIGTVVTGTLTGGTLARGQQVVVQARGQNARIRNIESHNRRVQYSNPGNRTALNLPNVVARSMHRPEGIGRGDVVTLSNLGEPGETINALLTRNPAHRNETARAIRNGARIRFHHGSANVAARIYLLEKKELLPGKRCHAQVRLESPLFAFAGDRFVIRDWPQRATIAGGVILDSSASRVGFRSQSEKDFLAARSQNLRCAKTWLRAQVIRDKVLPSGKALFQTCFSEQEISGAIDAISAEHNVQLFDELIVEENWWRELIDRAAALIDQKHADHPEEKGIRLTQLRQLIPGSCLADKLTGVLITHLCGTGFIRQDSIIMRASHLPRLSPRLKQASEDLQSNLRLRPLEPPSREELASDKLAQEALRFLIQTGEVIEIDKKLVMSAAAFNDAKESITAFLKRQGSASTSEIRRELGTSRRIAIPLLELLDRDGTTRREGPQRTLQSRSQES